jgi:succinate-semialdehyde dehydrogenase/glutarate-semialdehyde dehydrogenase
MATEMGKPIAQGEQEVEKCAWVCEHFAEHGAEQLRRMYVDSAFARSYLHFAPLGLVLAIMPWNFPLWQVFRCAAPALMAGNGILLKHARGVTGCSLAIEALFSDVRELSDVLVSLLIGVPDVPDLIKEPRVQAVALTGSVEAGRAVAQHAGAALKKSVLELGGNDPYLVLADADLELAASACANARLHNCGQSCIAPKRLIVVDEVHDAFVEHLVRHMSAHDLGDPLDPATMVGPLASRELRDAVHCQVRETLAQGARAILGGELPSGPGAFYPPSVLVDVRQSMAAAMGEVFGPVASVMRARDVDDAVRIANQSGFGLGGGVFSRDRNAAEEVARERLELGLCAVNDCVRSDPRLPFGGIKESGYGRELGPFGAREFTNVKTIMVA